MTTKQPSFANFQEDLAHLISKVEREGTFACHGSRSSIFPGLSIPSLGLIGLPLCDKQAEDIKAVCEQAPYGKGEDTIVDTEVRRVWQLMPDKFQLLNYDEWDAFLERTLLTVAGELGLKHDSLKAELYNLLLYETGSFFLPHRDGEKIDNMVATLVIVLPSSFWGGELIVRHDGQEKIIDFASEDNTTFRTHFAAFYADCEHEVKPLQDGYRLCLVYNLATKKSHKLIGAPNNESNIQEIVQALNNWSLDAGLDASAPGANIETPLRLAIKFEHQYSTAGFNWDTLKGIDLTRAHVLREAARRADCVVHLAVITFWEHGSAENYEGTPNRGRRGYRYSYYDEPSDSDDSEPGSYKLDDLYDENVTANNWINAEGRRVPLGQIVLEHDNFSEAELRSVIPEEDFEGYMGNYGMTLERWYRHAAIFIWPRSKHFDILCDIGTAGAVDELTRLLKEVAQITDDTRAAQLKESCVKLATKIIDTWKPSVEQKWLYDFKYFEQKTEETTESDDEDESADNDGDRHSSDDDDDLDDDDEIDDDPDASDNDVDFEHDPNAPHDDRIVILGPNERSRDGGRGRRTSRQFSDALALLNDSTLVLAYLKRVVSQDPSAELTDSLITWCNSQGWTQFKREFDFIYRANKPGSLVRNVVLLETICSQHEKNLAPSDKKLFCNLLDEILVGLKKLDKERDDWLTSGLDRDLSLASIIKIAVIVDGDEFLNRMIKYLQSNSKRYPVTPLIVASLSQIGEWLADLKKQVSSLSSLLSLCIDELEHRTAKAPKPPKDFRRDANITCNCPDCKELIEFLKDPASGIHRFRVRKDRRAHLHRMIERHECDVYHQTERSGSPQTLVCTKNLKSFEKSKQQFSKDRKDLKAIRELASQLVL